MIDKHRLYLTNGTLNVVYVKTLLFHSKDSIAHLVTREISHWRVMNRLAFISLPSIAR